MRRDLTGGPASQHKPQPNASGWPRLWQQTVAGTLVRLLAAALAGVALFTLAYQLPTTHTIDIGGPDAGYIQGFGAPLAAGHPALANSDGSARPFGSNAYLLFPQAGLPAKLTLHLHAPEAGPTELVVSTLGSSEFAQIQVGPGWGTYTLPISAGLLKLSDVALELRSNNPDMLLDRASYQVGPAPITPYPSQLAYGALASAMLWLLAQGSGVRGQGSGGQGSGVRVDSRPETRDPETGNPNTQYPIPNTQYPIVIGRSSLVVGRWSVALSILTLTFLLLYRIPPLVPYPLRWLLPAVNIGLAALLTLRYAPPIVRRLPLVLDAAALAGVAGWLVLVLLAAQQHVVLSIPGVEKDFGVFARRSAQLLGQLPGGVYDATRDGVLRADGFYNLGYPLLLWLARQFTNDSPFLAGRLVAALSGVVLLLATWWLARQLLGRALALLALALLALSPLVVQYTLYLGSDMPFAAFCTLALALLVAANAGRPRTEDERPRTEGKHPPSTVHRPPSINIWQSAIGNRQSAIFLAGLAAGAAFLMRHPGLLLLPVGWAIIWLCSVDHYHLRGKTAQLQFKTLNSQLSTYLLYTLAFLLAMLPQLIVNLRDTGNLLYNRQAENIWLGVFAGGDWGRVAEVPPAITLGQIIVSDAGRFAANYWANLRAVFGTGAEDTSEFGRAIQLRLLGFPANWLALAGLLGWLYLVVDQQRKTTVHRPPSTVHRPPSTVQPPMTTVHRPPPTVHLRYLGLLLWVGLYSLSVAIAFVLPRFFLPLAPVYALAAAWALGRLTRLRLPATRRSGMQAGPWRAARLRLGVSMLLVAMLAGGFGIGTQYVTRERPAASTMPGQAADEAAAARLVLATLGPGERLALQVEPADAEGLALGKYSAIAHLVVLTGGNYLLTTAPGAPTSYQPIGRAGRYTLYRVG